MFERDIKKEIKEKQKQVNNAFMALKGFESGLVDHTAAQISSLKATHQQLQNELEDLRDELYEQEHGGKKR